jgi:hypothetical protein
MNAVRLIRCGSWRKGLLLLFVVLSLGLVACDAEEPAPPAETAVVEAQPATATTEATASLTLAPTEPPTLAATATAAATATVAPSPTAQPTDTPAASPTAQATATEEPSPTPSPTNTRPPATAAPTRPPATAAPPTLSPNPTLGQNLLPNPSFEEGHFNQNGIPELQLPNGWRLDYQEGPTGFGNQAWDVFVRPETRVLSTAFLPPEEHGLYIFDGSQTVKIFKGAGAVSARLMTDVSLQPGTYVLEANFYSDVFESFSDGHKNPPGDPNAGEAMLFAGVTGTGYVGNNYLNRNNLRHTFTVATAQTMTVGVGFRGRYAIANNGWFVDNLSLRQLQ